MHAATTPSLRHRWLRNTLLVLGALVVTVWLTFLLSPWPGALVVRALFDAGAARTRDAQTAFAPQGVAVILGEAYRGNDADAFLDVYFPGDTEADARLPVLIWTHGGGWLSGSNRDTPVYFQLIAQQGFAVISLNYSLAPGAPYPTALHQINDALAFIARNAGRFHADMDRVFMAGDSAGAQLTSQLAAAITDPGYAAEIKLQPALASAQLRGLILHCGLYDLIAFNERAAKAGGFIGWGSHKMLWAFTGSRTPDVALLREASTIVHVTSAFPPVFISGGNGDPLTLHQSEPLAVRLRQLGVPVTTFFFAKDHKPVLNHEYQFELQEHDARDALRRTLEFLRERVAGM